MKDFESLIKNRRSTRKFTQQLLSPEQVPMAWTICLIVGIITFLSLVIFKGRDLWVELQKRLHL